MTKAKSQPRGAASDRLTRGRVEPPTEIGPRKVGLAVRRRAVQFQRREAAFAQARQKCIGIERRMDSIAGARVGELEGEVGGCRDRGAGARQGYPRRRRGAHAGPGIIDGNRHQAISRWKRGGRAPGSIRPRSVITPMRSSQSANSGAGSSPSRSRIAATS